MTNIEIKQFCLDGDRNTLKMFRRNSEHLDQVVQNDLLDKFVCSEVVHRPNALYHDEILCSLFRYGYNFTRRPNMAALMILDDIRL